MQDFVELERQITYTLKRSSFYKNKFKDIEFNFSRFEKSFLQLPFTTKQELLDDQKANPPLGSNLCVSIDKIRRIHKTSGTTNNPLLIALTPDDIKATVEVGRRCFEKAGLEPSDMVVHCLNYNMWIGGYTDHQSLEATGAAVIPFGVGNTNNLIEIVLQLKPTAIHCTPSYLAKIEYVLKTEFKKSPRNLKLKLGLFGGESGLQNPKFRKNIEDKWGLRAVNANFGMADVLSMFGAECAYRKGLHFLGKDYLYAELYDNMNKAFIPIKKGAEGELILTNIRREAQPLIRYRTNDIIKILSTEKCRCGETGFIFEVMGRTDDMIIVKGVNVFVNAIGDEINNHLDCLNGIYQICVNKEPPITRMLIRAESISGQHLNMKKTRALLLNEFKHKLFITPELEILPKGSLPRTSEKSRKILKIL